MADVESYESAGKGLNNILSQIFHYMAGEDVILGSIVWNLGWNVRRTSEYDVYFHIHNAEAMGNHPLLIALMEYVLVKQVSVQVWPTVGT